MLSCCRRRSATIASQRSGSAWAREAMPGVDTPGMLIVTSTVRSIGRRAADAGLAAIFPRSPDPGAAVRRTADRVPDAGRVEDRRHALRRDGAQPQDARLIGAAVDDRRGRAAVRL